MSETYKIVRNEIGALFKDFGIPMIISKWAYTILAIWGMIVGVIGAKNEDMTRKDYVVFIIAIIAITVYLAKKNSKKYQKEKLAAIALFKEKSFVQINLIQRLIEEIERYIKEMKTFITWMIGIGVTFAVLYITLIFEPIGKMVDTILQEASQEEVMEAYKVIGVNNFDLIIGTGMVIILFALFITIALYMIFSCLVYVKKQVLLFLYDVQYELTLEIQNDQE